MFYKVLLQPEIYQYDVNRKIQVLDKNINEIHFANYRNSKSLAVAVKEEDGINICEIPNKLLITSGTLFIYAYVKSTETSYTKYEDTINVIKREKPSNYFATDNVDILTLSPDKTYRHIQNFASSKWVIVHNLDKYPSCTVVDSAGSTVLGDVDYINKNTVEITFTGAFSGEAYLN